MMMPFLLRSCCLLVGLVASGVQAFSSQSKVFSSSSIHSVKHTLAAADQTTIPQPAWGSITKKQQHTTICSGRASSSGLYLSSGVSAEAVQVQDGDAHDRMPFPKGVIVALVTPFQAEAPHDIDVEAYKKLLQLHLDSGTNGLCVLGTTAEAAVMTMEERDLILKVTMDMCKGKLPIIVGCGTIDPNAVKAQILQAKAYGADGAMVVTPYYVKPPQRALVKHFCDAADLGLPLVLYNVPGRTGIDCTPATLAECVNMHPNVHAIKEATGDLSRVKQIQQLLTDEAKQRLLLYSGDDETSLAFIKEGGQGCISVSANVVPLQWQQAVNTLLDGDTATSDALGVPLTKIHTHIFCESNPMAAKWAMYRAGMVPNDVCRPPLTTLDPQYYPHVEEAMRDAGMIQ
jgi:4-hydroxy-tetrahydrodipicolinate synthase